MNKKLNVAVAALLAAASLAPMAQADTQVGITNINVTATVPTVATLNAEVFNLADDQPATAIGFGSVSSASGFFDTLPGQYVRLSVDNNAIAWRLRTYTNNFTTPPPTDVWGFQLGGLRGALDGAKVAMGWLNNPTSLAPAGPGRGNPADGTANGWTFFKDLNDSNDPATDGDDSFGFADGAGFTNIAFGGAAFTNIVRPNLPTGSEGLTPRTTPWFFYVEGNFNNAPGTTYTGTLVLELMNL